MSTEYFPFLLLSLSFLFFFSLLNIFKLIIFLKILKHTLIQGKTHLPFLDILLSIMGDPISTSTQYKGTDAHSALNYSSSHPIKTKTSIPFSQFLRLWKLCLNDPEFKEKAQEMSPVLPAMAIP